jgi:hypothetical protein
MNGVLMNESSHRTLRDLALHRLTIGEPDVSGALAVFPIFGGPPRFEYAGFAAGLRAGVTLKEIPGRASVRRLIIENPIALPVLLFEGEEALGAQQNRVFDFSVLVDARTTLEVPVSCVERGRWDGSRHDESMAAAPHAAFVEMRRERSELYATGAPEAAIQSAVWDSVGSVAEQHHVASATGAIDDVFADQKHDVDDLIRPLERRDGQLGMLVAIGGEFVVLDYVSRPAVFAELHGPLARGYALDALVRDTGEPPSREEAEMFLGDVLSNTVIEREKLGLGEQVQCVGMRTGGAGTVCGGELIAASVFADRPPGPQVPTEARPVPQVRPPSRRRNR